MTKTGLYGVFFFLSISVLGAVPQQLLDRTTQEPLQTQSPPVVDEATYLRVRTQLVTGVGGPTELPACHAAEIQRSERRFPEIRKDWKTFEAAIEQVGLQDNETFSDDEKLLIYRQYEALTSIHLEPARNKDGTYEPNSYLLTFVPSFHSDCDRSAPTATKPQLITLDPEGQIDFHIPKGPGFSVAQPLNSMSNAGPLRDLPAETNSTPKPAPPKPLPPRPPIHIEKLTAPELRYRLLQEFAGWRLPCEICGELSAPGIAAFPDIQKDATIFRVITDHLGLVEKKNFTDDEKLAVYREYQKLSSIHLELLRQKYLFSGTSGWGVAVWGLIDVQGRITVLKRKKEPMLMTPCPKRPCQPR